MGNKPEVIARKEKSVGVIFLVGVFVVLFVSVMAPITRSGELVEWIIFGVVLGGFFLSAYVVYSLKPNDLIMLDEDNNLHLPRGVMVALSEVIDVSYKCARGKSTTYEWGSVTIKTENAKYKCDLIADCAIVAERLTDVVKRAKSGDIN